MQTQKGPDKSAPEEQYINSQNTNPYW